MSTGKFEAQLEELGIRLDDHQKEQFQRYFELLTKQNQVMNLTGITNQDDVNEKHFIDSLAIVKVIRPTECHRLIDIGSGAGFPGIPLKIAFPNLQVALLDSLQKRARFLEEVIRELQLDQTEVLCGRAEDIAHEPTYREKFDLSVSRGVANLATLSEYCLPFVEIGGVFVSYKSGTVDEEWERSIEAIHTLGGKESRPVKYTLPLTDVQRSLIKVDKTTPTDLKYPRRAGKPEKSPIGASAANTGQNKAKL